MPKHLAARYSEIGCRIPRKYFWVIGWGGSDVGIETGSYDAALHMAGIENYNVLLYTSVLPPEAVELPHLPDIHHGSVLEGIIAVQHTDKPGTRITAGLLLAKVYRSSDGSYLGGFACEYAGSGSVEEAEANLREAMQQLFARRYKTKLYKLGFGKSVVRNIHAGKIVRDDSGWHRLRQLPRAGIKTRSGCNPFPQRQVAREIHDQVKSPVSTLLFQPEEAVAHAQISIEIGDPPASKWTTSHSQVQRSSFPARSLEDAATCYGSSSGVSLLRFHFGVGR